MLFIAAAVGIAGSFVFGLLGLVAGPAGQLERILAVICLAMTAAAVLGVVLDDGTREPSHAVMTREEKAELFIALPIALLMVGVLLATLVPAIYVMLPVFAARSAFLGGRTGPREVPPGRAHPTLSYA